MVLVLLYDRFKSEKELEKIIKGEYTSLGPVKTSGHYIMFALYDRADPQVCRVSDFMEHVLEANHVCGVLYDITIKGLSRLDQLYDVPRIRDRQLICLEDHKQAFAYITNKTGSGIDEARLWQLKTIKSGDWVFPKHITV